MRWLLAVFVSVVVTFMSASVPAPATAQNGGTNLYFCLAVDDEAQVYIHTAPAQINPNMSNASVESSFQRFLDGQGGRFQGQCRFSDMPPNLSTYFDRLRQQCDDCAVFQVRRIAWSPTPEPADVPIRVRDSVFTLQNSDACSMMNESNYRQVALSGGNDVQLKTMCGWAFEYYTMYKRAIDEGYSEADANRTYDAHQGAALNAISFYDNNRAERPGFEVGGGDGAAAATASVEAAVLTNAEQEAERQQRVAEEAAERAATTNLNRQIAERDAAIVAQNEAAQRAYEQGLARHQAEVDRLAREETARQARYQEGLARHNAEVARSAAARRAWQACVAGDQSQCTQ